MWRERLLACLPARHPHPHRLLPHPQKRMDVVSESDDKTVGVRADADPWRVGWLETTFKVVHRGPDFAERNRLVTMIEAEGAEVVEFSTVDADPEDIPTQPGTPEADWDRRYEDAMQWRDWQECEQLLEERARSDWWTNPSADSTEGGSATGGSV